MPSKKIIEILSFDQRAYTPLAHLLKQSTLQESWTSQLRSLLDADLAAHCTVRDLKHKVLLIQTTDATWATRLRFQQVNLLIHLKKLADFSDIREIRVQVVPMAHKNTELSPTEPSHTGHPPY